MPVLNQSSATRVSSRQDVRTGALVVFAASEPSTLDVSTLVLPLSLSKVFLAASWWDRKQPDLLAGTPSEQPVSVLEMLVGGSDSSGRQVAFALRKAVGDQAVLADFGGTVSTAGANRFGRRSIRCGRSA